MPRVRRSNIGRRSRHSVIAQRSRISQSEEQQNNRLAQDRQRKRAMRQTARNQSADNQEPQISRGRMSRIAVQRMERAAFNYDSTLDYSMYGMIGRMRDVCRHCNAYKFTHEAPGMCCASGKVRLPTLEPPPEPLHSLIFGNSPASTHFLNNIQKYNSCFQMTSFGATNIIRDQFMPTFKVITSCGVTDNTFDLKFNKIFNIFQNSDRSSTYICMQLQIQGQIYHRTGSLLPFADANYQFLQIYFIGDEDREVDQRCAIHSNTRRDIIQQLQRLLHEHNGLVRLFKVALDRMPTDNHKIVIRSDKTPIGEHARRFNAPTIDDVAIVIVGEQFQSRDIVLHRRNEQLQRVSELHPSYDGLQYPLIHWKGDDGYHINIPMIQPNTGN